MPEYWIRRAITVLVTPVGLAFISAVRLLVISNYNVTTAVTVAESGGYVNTFLGSLIPLVPVFMPYLALVFFAFRRFALCVMAIVATALISPVVRPQVANLRYFDGAWSAVVHWISLNSDAAVIVVSVAWVISLMIPWHRMHGHWVHTVFRGAWACAVIFAIIPYLLNAYPAPKTQNFYASYLRQPWLTAEQVAVAPDKIYQGYVLSSGDKWMTVLLFQSRTVAYFRADDVTARVVCRSQSVSSAPLVRLLNARSPRLPQCRDLDSWTVLKNGVNAARAKKPNSPVRASVPARAVEGPGGPAKASSCCRAGRSRHRRASIRRPPLRARSARPVHSGSPSRSRAPSRSRHPFGYVGREQRGVAYRRRPR